MDNLTFSKIKESLDKYNNIAVATPVDPTIDEMGAALALYLSLKELNKNLSIATPNEPLVEVSSLVGIDEVKTSLGSDSGDLLMYLPYKEGEIEKVSSVIEGNFLKLLVKAGEQGLGFSEKDIRFQRGANAPELLFVVGAARVSDLGNLFDTTALKDTVVINIDNKPDNQGFGDILMVSPRLSSISEAIANLILTLNLKFDMDISQNLMMGIATATNNFQDPKTSSLAFEMAGILMRNGALRPASSPQRRKMSMGLEDKEDIAAGRMENPQALGAPIQEIRTETQPEPQRVQPIQSLEKKQDKTLQTPPEDWLEPKIYKGSTNF